MLNKVTNYIFYALIFVFFLTSSSLLANENSDEDESGSYNPKLFGYAENGNFYGPIDVGYLLFSKRTQKNYTLIQTSVFYNESKIFMGGGQVGLVNKADYFKGLFQIGAVNGAKHTSWIGFQLGLINVSGFYQSQEEKDNTKIETTTAPSGPTSNSSCVSSCTNAAVQLVILMFAVKDRQIDSGFKFKSYMNDQVLSSFIQGGLLNINKGFNGVLQVGGGNINSVFNGGAQFGVASFSHYFNGVLQFGLIYSGANEFNGLSQIGAYNHSLIHNGAQIGIYNRSERINGLQIGVVNYAEVLHGVQIGIWNIAKNSVTPYFPLINIGW